MEEGKLRRREGEKWANKGDHISLEHVTKVVNNHPLSNTT